MNIFFLDWDVDKCAQYHFDKHMKMILESAQLLSTSHQLCGGHTDVYRATHKNHPSSIWVREGKDNYMWLYRLYGALSKEYTHRYGKVHKSWETLSERLSEVPNGIPNGWTKPKLAMPEEYQLTDPVEAYRLYYIKDKQHLAKWSKRNVPEWYK